MSREEVYVSIDIESSGPILGEYSMLSLGAVVVTDISKTFYREFRPITDRYVPEALQISGLSLEKLKETGSEPAAGMQDFENWIYEVSDGKRPVFTAFNATFDWMFVVYYFHRFLGRNPFGISGLDIKAYYMGKLGTSWVRLQRKDWTNALDLSINIRTTQWMMQSSKQKFSGKFSNTKSSKWDHGSLLKAPLTL